MNIVTSILALARTAFLLYRWRQRRKSGRSIRVLGESSLDDLKALDHVGMPDEAQAVCARHLVAASRKVEIPSHLEFHTIGRTRI